MKQNIIFFILFFLFIGTVQKTTANNSLEERYLAAKRYTEITPTSAMLNDTIAAISKKIPETKKAEFIAFMKKVIDINKLENFNLDMLVKHFTAQELNALANFYGSPVGRSIMGKLGRYMGDIQPIIQREISQALEQVNRK